MESQTIQKRTLIQASSLILFLLLAIHQPMAAQNIDTAHFETFDYQHEDSTYVMQKYFLAFLMKGDKRSEDEQTRNEIQNAHLAYLGDLYEKGLICMNGPFGDDGEIRGATVYRVASIEDAEKLANGDPAVKAGVLKVEIHPWWLARGTGVR